MSETKEKPYTPFGDEWEAFVMKLPKKEIVKILKSALNQGQEKDAHCDALRSNLSRIMGFAPCLFDTDGDGDCHKCHHVGGCSARFYEPKTN